MYDKSQIEALEKRIPKGEVRTRFAPSPTGYMHIGNLRTALYTYLIAKNLGGKFILRIEDTDQSRLVSDATEIIYKTMRECGLSHDEGPDVGGPVGPYIQTERRGIYDIYANIILEKGHAYRCFCGKSDAENEEHKKTSDPCRSLSLSESNSRAEAGESFVIRQKIPHEGVTTFKDEIFGEISCNNIELDDQVLIKSDGLPTYNFANVVDDHLMGITHVVRGTEYLSSTPKYNLLYEAFGWEIPKYIHCSPVMRDAQNKMSKRKGDPSYEDLIAAGYLTQAILNYSALLGWSPGGEREMFSLDELAQIFSIEGLSKSPAIFDIDKLKWLNGEYIRNMSLAEFAKIAEPYIRKAVKNENYDANKIAEILKQRTELLTEIPEKVDFFDALPEYEIELFANKKSKTDIPISLRMLNEVKPVLSSLNTWDDESILLSLKSLAEKLEVKNATVMWPLRIAVSGKAVTPGGAVEICTVLGKEETLSRIDSAIAKLEPQNA